MSSQSPKLRQENGSPAGNRPSNERATPGKETERSTESTNDEAETNRDDGTHELPLDLVFDALKNSRRRQALRYLKEDGERVSLGELAEHVAAIENHTTPERLNSQQRKRVYVGLYQCHLPRLDGMGVIEFNQSRGYVELGRYAPQLDQYLFSDGANDRPWFHHYLGLLAVSTLVLALGAASDLIAITDAAVLFAGITAGLSVLAGVHAHERRK